MHLTWSPQQHLTDSVFSLVIVLASFHLPDMARITWEEGAPTEELPPSKWPVGMPIGGIFS